MNNKLFQEWFENPYVDDNYIDAEWLMHIYEFILSENFGKDLVEVVETPLTN